MKPFPPAPPYRIVAADQLPPDLEQAAGLDWKAARVLSSAPAEAPRDQAAPALPPAASWALYDLAADRLLGHEPAAGSYPPAGLAKLATAMLVERKLVAERRDRRAERTPVAVGAEAMVRLSVQRLLEAVLIASSDSAAFALAAWHSGTTEAFVEAMNRQAAAWGLRDTRFACPAGQDESARSNAGDVLRLAARLMHEHPALAAIAGKTRLDPWEQALPNVNLLLGTVRGVDGLAAAFSPATGAHQIATAAHEGRRLLAVVLGAPDRVVCARLAAALLRKGFSMPAAAPAPA